MAAPLERRLGVVGATAMGLGSIIGTGIFVSVGLAAGTAGAAVLPAIALAALVAACNGLSSAQLAANHPVSGGTYEYGYRYLRPWLGFTAGWVFLLAKSASAATAALGLSGYALDLLGLADSMPLVPPALLAVAALTAVVLGGVRGSSRTNAVVVAVSIGALAAFAVVGLPHVRPHLLLTVPGNDGGWQPFLEATALMFVAFTGYGRIATLGEDVRDPAKAIPRAIVATLIVSSLLYLAVAYVAVGTAGAEALGSATRAGAAPLEAAAHRFGRAWLPPLLAFGAVAAMAGVLLNLLLGLSRVLLAMGRRGDMPERFGRLNASRTTPPYAVLAVGGFVAVLAAIGDVRLTWSFSAFTVLVYYAITNLAALQLAPEARRFPRAVAWVGLAACVFLAFWVDWRIWMPGLGLIGAGLLWHGVAVRRRHIGHGRR